MYQVNVWAVIVAGVVAWVIGALWYSQLLVGKQWMKLANLKDVKPNPVIFIVGLLTYIVMAYVLAHVLIAFNATSIAGGLIGGFWMWLGFVATITLGSVLYEQKPFMLWVLNNAYNLISFLVMGAILALWR
ncbi:MAG: DUF1761 domain-containing protein [Candidatus Margulisbacteria bacterium]|nr:DUF1761 domain-containing protein [Candidatus Margulisiibacteriota bacterium]